MRIEEAIKSLTQAKDRGVRNIVMAFWEASMFSRSDDRDWATLCDLVDDNFDWHATHDDLYDFLVDECGMAEDD